MKKTFFLLGVLIFSLFEAYPNVKDLYENINHSTTSIAMLETYATNSIKPTNTIQDNIITGQITDETGIPMPGVNVLVSVEGRPTIGVVTDFDGNYSIEVPANAQTIVFSYLGYEEQRVQINNRQVINVTMQPELTALNEVVVTGLGIRKESKKLGYSVESVSVNELQENRTTNIATGLEGKIAGLDISPPSSGAGGSTKIRLRGQAAFAGGNNSPLIVVNGLPMDQGARGADGDNSRDLGDDMQNFNPDDVESMTVLKGATAAAIYGSRAANGAIIITTKSGQRGQGIGVELSSSFTTNTALDFTDFQQEYGQGENGVRPATQGDAAGNGQFGWGERLDGVPTINFDGVLRPYSANPNRITEYYRTGTAITNSVALSGGGEKGNFRASFTNTDASGIDPTNEYSKKIVNIGLNHDITEKLSLSLNVNYTHEDNENPPQVGVQGPGAPNFLYRMSTSIPLSAFRESAVNSQGVESLTSGFQGTLINPYYQQGRQFYNNIRDRFLGTATVRYEFTDWLYAQGRYNYDYADDFRDFNSPTGMGSSTPFNQAGTAFGGTYEVSNGHTTQVNADFLIGVNKEFGDFSADVSIGGNIYKTKSRNFRQWVEGFVARDLYTIENGFTKNQSYGISRSQINSLYALADFGYKDILFLNATIRNDWFSVLNPDNNSFLYPSVGGSFIFSELMRESNWLTYGKLRASYAEVGSANGLNPFAGNLTYSILQNPFGTQTLGSIANAGQSPNPLLKPFGIEEKEVGLELRMFNSRVNLDIAVYEKITTDQILNVQISQTSGYPAIPQNLASLSNRGVEFLIDVTPVQTDNFTWNSAFNTSFNETEVLELAPGIDRLVVQNFGGNEFIGQLVYEVGQPLNQISARTYELSDSGQIQVDDNGFVIATSEYKNFGSALPKFVGGWNNVFTYKNLSLLVHMDYKAGGKVISSSALNGLRQGHTKASLVGREGEVILPDAVYASNGQPNTSTPNPATFYAGFRNNQIGDPFVFKSDFIKLRNITLTYDLTSLLRDNSFIQSLRLSAFCRNVAILYKDLPDLDPEAFASSGAMKRSRSSASSIWLIFLPVCLT